MMYNRGDGYREKIRSYYLPGNSPAPFPAHGSTSNARGADKFDPCCYFHPVRLVRQAISWLVITSNLLPVPALSIIHHQLLPTRAGNALQRSSRCKSSAGVIFITCIVRPALPWACQSHSSHSDVTTYYCQYRTINNLLSCQSHSQQPDITTYCWFLMDYSFTGG